MADVQDRHDGGVGYAVNAAQFANGPALAPVATDGLEVFGRQMRYTHWAPKYLRPEGNSWHFDARNSKGSIDVFFPGIGKHGLAVDWDRRHGMVRAADVEREREERHASYARKRRLLREHGIGYILASGSVTQEQVDAALAEVADVEPVEEKRPVDLGVRVGFGGQEAYPLKRE